MNKYKKGEQDTVAERLFKTALNQYHSNLLTTYANVISVSIDHLQGVSKKLFDV